jgi:hypothetical protein
MPLYRCTRCEFRFESKAAEPRCRQCGQAAQLAPPSQPARSSSRHATLKFSPVRTSEDGDDKGGGAP